MLPPRAYILRPALHFVVKKAQAAATINAMMTGTGMYRTLALMVFVKDAGNP